MDEVTTRPAAAASRRMARVLCAFVVASVLVVTFAGPASAHAEFEASDPVAGELLPTQPRLVTLIFSEPVEVSDTAIEVFDDHLKRVDTGQVQAAPTGPDRFTVRLRPDLSPGTYTVNWHVSSADTHSVSGSYEFSISARTVVVGPVPGSGRNDVAGGMLGVLRWMGFLGLALGPGVMLVALLLWPLGLQDRRTRRLTFAGLLLLAVSTLGSMLLQGVWASGVSFSALWSAPDTLDTHSGKFDVLYAWRSYLLIGFSVALAVSLVRTAGLPTHSRRIRLGAIGASTVALLATWPLGGHSAVGSMTALALVANFLHVFAMTVWLGGLALVLISLSSAEHAAERAQVLPRFSRLALVAVATLVGTGVFMAWREMGSVGALTATSFGQLLLVKLSGVAVLILLGNVARLWVKRHLGGLGRGDPAAVPSASLAPADAAAIAGLRRGIAAEVVVAAGVLAITAALIVIDPRR